MRHKLYQHSCLRDNIASDIPVVNRREIRVAGIPRSGQHAIIQWIIYQAKTDKYVYLNACQDDCFFDPYNNRDPNSVRNVNKLEHKDLLLYNFEMRDLPMVFNYQYEQCHDQIVGRSESRRDILILRDPYNNMASLYKWGIVNGWATREWMLDIRELWKSYAREYLGETSFLIHNKTCINYNSWFTNWRYRKQLIEKLGYDFDEYWIINVVAKVGIASLEEHTFDGLRYDGRAQEMKVLERWKHYQDDPVFHSLFDEEFQLLSWRIFGDIKNQIYGAKVVLA